MRTFLPALLCLASCTLATDATDRKVDPSLGRDLDYTFKAFNPHAGTPLDVVLVEQVGMQDSGLRLRLRAHARIVLPPDVVGTPYPDQGLELANVLTGAPAQLLFYADTNADDAIRAGILSGTVPDAEHIWIESVPKSGIGEFTHRFNFQEFLRSDYSLGTGDVVLDVTDPSADWRPPACDGAARVLEVAVTVAPGVDDQEIGYYRNFSSNAALTKAVRLDDIVDAGNQYTFEVRIDGVRVKNFAATAPQLGGELRIPQSAWLPTIAEAPGCPPVARGQ